MGYISDDRRECIPILKNVMFLAVCEGTATQLFDRTRGNLQRRLDIVGDVTSPCTRTHFEITYISISIRVTYARWMAMVASTRGIVILFAEPA